MDTPEPFWKQRYSSAGRPRAFKTAKQLWEAACAYFEATDKRKWIKTEFNGKDATECHIPIETPYTISGFCIFIGRSRNWWNEIKKNENLDPEYLEVLARIEDIMFTQKFEGAAVGAFTANIISRDLGLLDRSEHILKNEVPLFPDNVHKNNGNK